MRHKRCARITVTALATVLTLAPCLAAVCAGFGLRRGAFNFATRGQCNLRACFGALCAVATASSTAAATAATLAVATLGINTADGGQFRRLTLRSDRERGCSGLL